MIESRFTRWRRACVAAAVACALVVAACGGGDDPSSPYATHWVSSWDHPRPSGAAMRGIGGWTEFDQWAVGDGGLIAHYRGLEWRMVPSPTTHTLFDVVGFSPTDVFMVGAAGTVLGPGLVLQPSTTSNDLYSLFGFSAINLIAVGANGTIVANDGGGWQAVTSPTSNDLYGVWCLTNGEKVAVGAAGTVIQSNGGPWSVVPAFTSRDLNAVWADKPGDWFAVGDGGEIWRDDGSGWSPMASPRSDDLYDVFGSDSAYVFAVGDGDSILFYDQIAWRPVVPSPSGHMDAIWATICPLSASPPGARAPDAVHCSNTYFAGAGGVVTRYTLLSSYEMQTDALTFVDLHGIHGQGSQDVYAVGDDGTLLRRDATGWSLSPTGVTETLRDVFVVSPLDVYAVGDGGRLLRGADGAWTASVVGTGANLRGIWVENATRVIAVGDAGTILLFDGFDWIPEAAPVADYTDVWGFSSDEALAVARGGVIATRDPGGWSTMRSPIVTDLNGVWGTSPQNAFAVGDAGVIIRLGGDRRWGIMATPALDDWVAVSGSGSEVWAVGAGGNVLRYDGVAWNVEESPPVAGLGGVFVRSGEVFATGTLGAVVAFRLEADESP
jgi:hypothetical protein